MLSDPDQPQAPPPVASQHLTDLHAVLADCGPVTVACSGGIDSLVLATIAHQRDPDSTRVAHTVTPAVPSDATARVMAFAEAAGWQLQLVRSKEFDDERYLSNPTDRCYFCKTNLYDAVAEVASAGSASGDSGESGATASTVISGANVDDLGEYRPGLIAADEHQVRHPYVEAGVAKAGVRALARHFNLDIAELPASPCLASRLYTGTRVTATRLQAVELGEAVMRQAGFAVARCRIREGDALIEVPDDVRDDVTGHLVDQVAAAMRTAEPSLAQVSLDHRPYRPGQAVLAIS